MTVAAAMSIVVGLIAFVVVCSLWLLEQMPHPKGPTRILQVRLENSLDS